MADETVDKSLDYLTKPLGKQKLSDRAQKYTDQALQCLVDELSNVEKGSQRVAAAKELLNRGWGQAPASLEVTGAGGSPLRAVLNISLTKDEDASNDE